MGITASDVVSDDDVRAIVEKIRNEYYQARRAFRGHDATDINSNSFDFPVSESDFDGEAVEIPEGAEYPRASKSYGEVSAAYSKYGFEVPITDEAVDDGYVDVEMDVNEDMVRSEEKRMDTIAFNVLSNNTNSTVGPIDANSNNNDTIEEADINLARQKALEEELSLSNLELYADASDMTDFLNMNGFTQASELGDFVTRRGILPEGDLANQAFLGVVSDIPVYLSNTGDFNNGEAFLVDRSNFGWESMRWDTDVDSYREESNDQDVFKIRGRWDWVATKPEANIEINT